MNYLSREGYFALKKEICLIAQTKPTITTKIPGEMKILLISMERSGSSWFAAHMSIEHMKVYGKLPLWNHECDRRYAVFKRVKTEEGEIEIETPIGWTSVYDVDPKEALEKDFDKIILLQKDLEQLKEDICKYNHPEKWQAEQETGEENDFFRRLRLNIEKWWNTMFGQEIDDPRLYKISLEELNNFTEWEWDKLLDFLEFPERSRCHSFAVNRNWQVYSDVLPTGYPLCARLLQLEEVHPNVLAKEIMNEDIFFFKLREKEKLTTRQDYPFINKVNPYVRMPYEKIPLETRGFRLTPEGDIKDVITEDKRRIE